MIFYLLPFLLALLPQSSYQIGFVRPLTPFGATFVNTKLPSIYNLHFSLSSGLRSDAYIKVKFANYTTLGTPTCLYGVNLTTGRPTATKACNVVSDSIYLAPGTALESEDQIYLTIFLSQTIPDSPGYTELFEVSTVSSTDSSTAVIFDTNPGFGNFLWGANSNVGTLFMEGLDFGTDATRNLQGASNNVTLHVRFNRGFTAELSRILVVVDMPWKFNSATTEINVARSPLYNVAVANNEPTDLYDTPTINKTQIINDQVIEIYFNGAFPEGREFLMTVTDIVNPIAIASGKLRFYSTDYTSNSVLEANENTVIYTSDNTIDLGISLAAGLPLTVGGPVKLYKNTEQYLKLSFDVGATTIPAGATLKYQFSLDNTPIPGTLFIYKTLTPLTSNSKVAYTYGTDYITLSNLGPLTAGDVIFIQTKMLFSKVQPQLKVTISILFDGVVVKYGESQVFPLNTNAKTAIVSIQGQNAEQNVFDVVNSATIMTFNFYSDTRTTAANSAITIYTNAFISSSGITCNAVSSPAVTAPTCTLTPSSAGVTYTKITITSAANTNVLATGQNVAITLGNLVFAKPSSHEEAIYEFYVRIDKDGTGNAAVQDAMVYAFVRPNRNQLTNLYQYHSLDVSSNTLAQFPSFMRVYGKLNTGSITIAPGANDNVVLTIYGYNTLADFLAVTNEGTFPCGASLSVSCVYIKGNPNKLSTNPIDWDRVIITLDSSATSNDFNFYIPQFFKDATAQPYEFVIGLYDRTTRIYQNTYLENQYSTSPARTPNSFTVTPSGLISNAANLYIDLRGQRAGVTVSSPIALSLETQGGYTFNGAPGGNTGASAVVITEWDLWNSQAVVQSVSTPLSTDDADATVYLRYTTTTGDNQNAVLFPMVGAASPQKLFMIDKVEMPYSLDIPNYVMYITNQMGTLTYWNSLINAGRNALINSSITDFSFNCTHMIQGYLNTYCQVSFTTNAKIDRQAKIRIAYSNAFISIAQCSLTYLTGPSTWSSPVSSSLYSCSSALQQIELSFDMADRLPVTTYQLTFYGFDQGSGSDQSLTFSIYDANYGFVVEQANKNYFLEEAIRDWISIASINYDFLNLDAISNFRLNFTLPRDIYPNEILEFDIGADLQSNNKNTDRLAIVLVNDNTRVEIYGTLKSQILTMQFGQGVQLAAGNYQISILNMKTPTTHSTDKVKIRLRRSTDSVFVMQSQEASFTSYPTLIQGASSFVKIIQSRFLCVACLGEFTFQVSLTNSYIDQNSTIYIHFPSYFLPAITNQAGKLDCRFGFDPVQCGTDPDYPFRLRITGSPFNYNPGSTFNITVYGFIVPNVITVEEAQEDIFFAVDSWYNGTFSEQSNVQLPSMTTIKSNMGAVFFYGLTIARTVVRDKIDHVLRANITANIPVNSTFSVTFTNEYSNLRYLESLPCGINVYINGIKNYGYASANCSIVGQSVKFFITKAISKDYSLELTISSVPTPPKLTTVDPNEFILAAFGVDENDVLAISRETLNSIYYLNFIDAINTIEAQSNNDIILTRGTYSDDIFIGTNGGKRTIQDVSITATAEGFTFAPAVIEFFVGDISHTFKVGCDQNIKLRTYPFNFTQTQDEALVNAYGDMFNVRVTVVDTPVVINIPTEIIVPKGGSSLPIPVQLAQKPFKDMQILIGVDNAYFDGAFGVDLDYSAPSLNFSSTDGLKYLSFYSTDAISSFPSTFTVNLQLDGSNYKSYNLSTYQITIKIQTVAFGTASILATQGLIQKTQAAFSITPAAEGMLVVQLSQDCVARQTLSGIKNILRNNSYANTEITNTGCPQRYLTQVLSTPGVAVTLNLPDLTPETKYNVYMYFENKAKQSNSEAPASFTFTTNSLDATLKMSATFSKTVYLDQLNSVICFLLRLFQTRIVNVVDAGGLSCSSYIEPTNRFLDYPGAYFGNYANTYTFYLLPDPTLEVDTSLTLVPTYFDTTTLLAKTGLYTAAAAEGITFLQEFKMDYYFTYNQAKTSTGSVVMPSLTSYTTDTTTVDGNSTIRLTNFRMTAKGSVYAIAREVAKVIVDPEDEFTTTDVTTRLPRTPTNAQIYACLDWNGDKVDACGRAIIANNDNVELLLRDLKSNTMYIVYYTVANEYPIEPIFGNDIQSFNVRILSSSTIVMAWMVLLGCILSLFM